MFWGMREKYNGTLIYYGDYVLGMIKFIETAICHLNYKIALLLCCSSRETRTFHLEFQVMGVRTLRTTEQGARQLL